MKVTDLIRLLRKHIVLLLITPVVLAALVTHLTRDPDFRYASETILYTGLATGSSVEMNKSFNFFASNTAFDNLINVIKSRETQQEVAIRLLAQHLLLPKYDPRYISKSSYLSLKKMTPDYVNSLVANTGSVSIPKGNLTPGTSLKKAKTEDQAKIGNQKHTVAENQTLYAISIKYGISVEQIKKLNGLTSNNIRNGQELIIRENVLNSTESVVRDSIENPIKTDSTTTFSFSSLSASSENLRSLPASINFEAYEQTVKNLTDLMNSSDTNFVYKLLNFSHPHYSIKSISTLNVQRIANSDLVRLKYETDDPGVCQQTLELFTEVCIKNYKSIKENRSDAVVKYFEFQLKQAAVRLKIAEDKLLQFNKDNNIINYYEQSKAVAVVKEDLDVEYNNKRIKLAGIQAAIKRLEEKLGNQQQIQLKSAKIIQKRDELGELNFKIASAETMGFEAKKDNENLIKMKVEAERLKDEIKVIVSELYTFGNTIEGLPIGTILNDWITNVIEAENTKAGIAVLGDRIKEFQKQYAIYAPAGANIKRIEREISVSEQEFLEILHGLNLAKLKMQDNELSSNIKAVDPPFYPLSPIPGKRKLLIVVAGMLGFMFILVSILVLEYFDDTLKNPTKAARILKLPFLAVLPKILLRFKKINFPFITNRLLEIGIQNMELYLKNNKSDQRTKTILFFSTLSNEGKTVVACNLAQKLKKQGKKVLVLNFSRESLRKTEISQIGYPDTPPPASSSGVIHQRKRLSIVSWLMGYPDTRIDFNSPFLEPSENYLSSEEYMFYKVDEPFYAVNYFKEILDQNNFYLSYTPDYVLIELPPVLYYPYPVGLMSHADVPILVCRSNRAWSDADMSILDIVIKTTEQKTHFILNGVELQVIESVLGDLPKKRSWFRRKLKNVIRFQFFSRNQL